MLGVGVEVSMKNISYHFIGGQARLNTYWHAKMSLALNKLINDKFLFKESERASKAYKT
jgi:hypothetical protein